MSEAAAGDRSTSTGDGSGLCQTIAGLGRTDDNPTEDLIDDVHDKFGVLHDALDHAVGELVASLLQTVAESRATSLVDKLVLIAGSAAIAGVAGTVGAIVGSYLRGIATNAEAGFFADSAKDLVKRGLHAGSQQNVSISGVSPLDRFVNVQQLQLEAAKSSFFELFNRRLKPVLRRRSTQFLLDVAGAVESARDEARAEQKRSSLVEWINFVARCHHGPEEVEDGTTEAGVDSNVDPAAVRKQGLLDITQKQFLPARHGILEIGLQLNRDKTDDGLRVDDWQLVSMELRGVHPNARAMLRAMQTKYDLDTPESSSNRGSENNSNGVGKTRATRVGEIAINKIVRVFLPQMLNPPEPEIAVLVTADGEIRGGASAYHLPRGYAASAVETAQRMSIDHLR